MSDYETSLSRSNSPPTHDDKALPEDLSNTSATTGPPRNNNNNNSSIGHPHHRHQLHSGSRLSPDALTTGEATDRGAISAEEAAKLKDNGDDDGGSARGGSPNRESPSPPASPAVSDASSRSSRSPRDHDADVSASNGDRQQQRPSPVDILARIFPHRRRALLQLVLQGCHGDVLQAIEQILNRTLGEGTCNANNHHDLIAPAHAHQQHSHHHAMQQFASKPYCGAVVSTAATTATTAATQGGSTCTSIAAIKSAFSPIAGAFPAAALGQQMRMQPGYSAAAAAAAAAAQHRNFLAAMPYSAAAGFLPATFRSNDYTYGGLGGITGLAAAIATSAAGLTSGSSSITSATATVTAAAPVIKNGGVHHHSQHHQHHAIPLVAASGTAAAPSASQSHFSDANCNCCELSSTSPGLKSSSGENGSARGVASAVTATDEEIKNACCSE